jgi:acyl-CoA reductase-like NAD-dependent aldehyde dehydrogenase
MRIGHQNSHKYQIGKALFTHPMVGNAYGTKGTRCVSYSLIAVHEEAADEGAHEQLIADRFCL